MSINFFSQDQWQEFKTGFNNDVEIVASVIKNIFDKNE